MAAIGDAEGTVFIMQLSKPLVDTSSKEKEVMQQVFEREARREKNLEIAKKLANDALAKAPVKKTVDPEKEAAQREIEQAENLKNIEEGFFKHVAVDENDIDVIKARGEMSRDNDVQSQHSGGAVKIDKVELTAGQKYTIKTDDGAYPFSAEAGGIIAGEGINGSVQAGKIIFQAGGKDYEGNFASATLANCTWKDAAGKTGSSAVHVNNA